MPPIYETIASPFVPSSDHLFRPTSGDYSGTADGGIYLAVGYFIFNLKINESKIVLYGPN